MTPLLAYFGPETVLPATSIVATILGVALMLGKNSLRWGVGLVKNAVNVCLRRKASPKASTTSVKAPHFASVARPRVKDDVKTR